MSEFKKNVGAAINAMVNIGFTKPQALEVLMREAPYEFAKFFTEDTINAAKSGYYYMNTWGASGSLTDRLRRKIKEHAPDFYFSNTVFSVSTDKIVAIKYVRALTGWGLKESKDFVEGMNRYLTEEQATDLIEMFGDGIVAI